MTVVILCNRHVALNHSSSSLRSMFGIPLLMANFLPDSGQINSPLMTSTWRKEQSKTDFCSLKFKDYSIISHEYNHLFILKVHISVPFPATFDNKIMKLFFNKFSNHKKVLWSGAVQWPQKKLIFAFWPNFCTIRSYIILTSSKTWCAFFRNSTSFS